MLVGNGPSAIEKKVGGTIDSKDFVVRFNQFEIEGFEQYVGTRTDMWFLHHGRRGNARAVVDFKGKPPSLIYIPYRNKKIKSSFVNVAINRFLDEPGVEVHTICSSGLGQNVRTVVRNEARLGRPPTSGFIAISAFLDKGATVYIHGFDILKKEDCPPMHYYKNDKSLAITKMWDVHNPIKEADWVEQRISEGRVILL